MAKEQVVDIGKRLRAAFGLISANVSQELDRAGFKHAIGRGHAFVQDARTSFEEITLTHEQTVLNFGFPGLYGEWHSVFAPPPMVSFRKWKRMEETVINNITDSGQIIEGQVVEHYGHTPWDITIQGILIDMENHVYPAEKVNRLVRMFEIDDIWNVDSTIFQNHQIKSIYFTDIDSSGVQGFEDTWSYTLNAKSIKDISFDLKSKQ